VLDWLIYTIPWQAWLVIGIAVIIVISIWASAVGGIKNALLIAGAAAVALTAGVISTKGRQQGRRDQQEKEQRNANATLDKAHRARADAGVVYDNPNRLRDDDGFRRDD